MVELEWANGYGLEMQLFEDQDDFIFKLLFDTLGVQL
jgi:hypothetical protein